MKNRSTYVILGIVFSLFLITGCGISSGGDTAANPNIYIDNSNIAFVGTFIGNRIDQTININNNGVANLNIGQILSPNQPFSISDDTCSNSILSPLESCSIKVSFIPTNQGLFTGSFSIPSNDPDSETSTVNLSGDGYGLNVWIDRNEVSVNCPNISIDVTVTDSTEPVTSTSKIKFTLKQNNTYPPILSLINTDQDPISVVLALDLSTSLYTELGKIQEAAKSFVSRLENPDEAAICKFRDEIQFLPTTGFETDIDQLMLYIGEDFIIPDGTALYDAVYASIDRASNGNINNKPAVIVLSDGANNHTGGIALIEEVINHAVANGIPIFTIFYVSPAHSDNANPDVMKLLAYETGGQYYNSSDIDDLNEIYGKISQVLSNKYTITYPSPICTGSVELEVRAEYNGLYGVDSKIIELP